MKIRTHYACCDKVEEKELDARYAANFQAMTEMRRNGIIEKELCLNCKRIHLTRMVDGMTPDQLRAIVLENLMNCGLQHSIIKFAS